MTLKEIAPIIDLDLERIVALFMGKEEMYVKFLRKFPENVSRLLDDLEIAVKDDNHEAIEAAVHGIKGVASNLGIGKVTDLGTTMLSEIRSNNFSNLNEHYPKLIEETNQAITYIEQLD